MVAGGQNRGLGSVVDPKFVEDVIHVGFDRVDADIEEFADLGVGIPLRYEAEDLGLPVGQIDAQTDIAVSERHLFFAIGEFVQFLGQ